METSSKPHRQQRPEAEIKALLSEHERSNLTVKEFCELYEISEQTFYNWRNKHFPKVEKEETFVELNLPASSLPSAEIELPGKGIIRFFYPLDASFVKSLM
jgi:hypothetical protein